VAIDDARGDALPLVMSGLKLARPRSYGDVWLGCVLWDELGLGGFWEQKLGRERGAVAWSKVLQVLAVNRPCDPATEFVVHRRWFVGSAMDELPGLDFPVVAKDRLYRCLDRVLKHKEALCQFLVGRWRTPFDASFDVLPYDLTSTCFEGSCAEVPKAKHGYGRDGRPDCRQVVIALVVTAEGFPMAYEVLDGNTSDKATLATFLEKIQSMYGKSRRVWVMDRGIPVEVTLATMGRGRRVPGRHAQIDVEQGGTTAGRAAVGAGPRRDARAAVGAGRRAVRAGRQPRPAAEGDRHPPAQAQAVGPRAEPAQAQPAAESRHAAEARGGATEGGRPGEGVRDHRRAQAA
jgi:hypothetical protein